MRISLFGPVDLTPDYLASLAPHDRSQLARMIADRGLVATGGGAGAVVEALGIGPAAYLRLYEARHAFRIEGAPGGPADNANGNASSRKVCGYTSGAAAILLWLSDRGGATVASRYDFVSLAGADVRSVPPALERLVAAGMILRGAPGPKGGIRWIVTEDGEALAARMRKAMGAAP